MILPEEEVKERMESPMNLLNRLKSITSPHSSKSPTHPGLPPKSDDIIPDINEKIAFGSVKSKAMGIMADAMNELKHRIPEVHKPESLARIAAEMGKVVGSMEEKDNADKRVGQIIIYAPTIMQEREFEFIDVQGIEA